MSATRNKIAVFASVVALMVGEAKSIQAQNLSFQKLAETPIGQGFSGPFFVATGDLDGDGKLDLVVGNQSKSEAGLMVLLGNGDGAFRPGVSISLAAQPGHFAVADLDRDGHLDIVATRAGPNGIAVLLGNGDGTFRPPQSISVSLTGTLLAEDLDGDGIIDLAVGQEQGVLLLIGKGDGTFRDPVAFPTPLQSSGKAAPARIRSADVNLDGRPDLIVLHPLTGLVSLLVSTAGGGFRHDVLSAEDVGYARDVAIADFNKDGKPDLAVCGDYGYVVLAGNGDGSFQHAPPVKEGAFPLSFAVGDFNSDGTPDLIIGNYYGGKISVLLGRGDGTFFETPFIQSKGDNFSVVVADMDGDGKPDVVAANYSSRSVTVALGAGEGKFRRPIILGSLPATMVAADFDGDGKSDLAVVNYLAETVDVLSGGSEPNGSYLVGDNPNRVYVDDFTRDGLRNLIVAGGRDTASGYLESAYMLFGTGGGRFRTGAIVEGGIAAVADFDRDGIADLAVTTWANSAAGVRISSILILSGKGDGSFERVGEIEGIANLNAVVVGDFNRDGIPDLAVTAAVDREAGVALIFVGKGGGKFQAAGRYPLAANPACSSILVADFNGDGRPDLAVNCGTSISILLGAFDGSFTPAPSVAGRGNFTAGDFDGDGIIDLAVSETPVESDSESTSSFISVHRGAGDGKFKEPVRVYTSPANSAVGTLVAADFDGDGRTDLAAMVYNFLTSQGTVSILASRTAP